MDPNPISDEVNYKLFKMFAENPDISQRQAARELGISLGKVNYCLRAFVDRGWIKVTNFTASNNKKAYMYMLTPSGVRAKAQVAKRFLEIKVREYEALREEIEQLRREAP